MRADEFTVENNVILKFKSCGVNYVMSLGVENGVIRLISKYKQQIILLGKDWDKPTEEPTGELPLIEADK